MTLATDLRSPTTDLVPPISDQPRAVAPVEQPELVTEVTESVTAKHRYRAAYCSGIQRGKGTAYAWPTGPAEKYADEELGKAIQTFAISQSSGNHLRGDDLLGFIAAAAEDFASHVVEIAKKKPDEVKFWSGFGPKGLVRYLNQEVLATEARNVG